MSDSLEDELAKLKVLRERRIRLSEEIEDLDRKVRAMRRKANIKAREGNKQEKETQ